MDYLLILKIIKLFKYFHVINLSEQKNKRLKTFDEKSLFLFEKKYDLLMNCNIITKIYEKEDFVKIYLSSKEIENDRFFFPISEYPKYLDIKNFEEEIYLNYLILDLEISKNCEITKVFNSKLRVCNEKFQIGIEINWELKKKIQDFIIRSANNDKMKIIITFNEEIIELPIISIIGLGKYKVEVSTDPKIIRVDKLIKKDIFPLLSSFQEKYYFLHYFHSMINIKNNSFLKTILNEPIKMQSYPFNENFPFFLLSTKYYNNFHLSFLVNEETEISIGFNSIGDNCIYLSSPEYPIFFINKNLNKCNFLFCFYIIEYLYNENIFTLHKMFFNPFHKYINHLYLSIEDPLKVICDDKGVINVIFKGDQ